MNEVEDREKTEEAKSKNLVTGAEEVALNEMEIWQALRRMKDKKATQIVFPWKHGNTDSDKKWFQRIIESSMEIRKLSRRVENRGNCADIQERRPRQGRKL